MSAKKRRKIYGVRRETRRPRGWTRWFQEGLFETESSNSIRLRTTLWGQKIDRASPGASWWLRRPTRSGDSPRPLRPMPISLDAERLIASLLAAASHNSGDDLPGHLSADVGQAEVAAAVAVGQTFVVQAHEVQDRGVQVVHVHPIGHGAEAELVGGAVHMPPLTPPPASHIVKPRL